MSAVILHEIHELKLVFRGPVTPEFRTAALRALNYQRVSGDCITCGEPLWSLVYIALRMPDEPSEGVSYAYVCRYCARSYSRETIEKIVVEARALFAFGEPMGVA